MGWRGVRGRRRAPVCVGGRPPPPTGLLLVPRNGGRPLLQLRVNFGGGGGGWIGTRRTGPVCVRGRPPPRPSPANCAGEGERHRIVSSSVVYPLSRAPFIPSPACGRGCGSQAAGEGPRGRQSDARRRTPIPRRSTATKKRAPRGGEPALHLRKVRISRGSGAWPAGAGSPGTATPASPSARTRRTTPCTWARPSPRRSR
jgi:hypothetical protein